MPLVSEQLPNLMNGVSQQAASMRRSSQAEAQVNGFSSVVEGVNKRPPTEHLAKLMSGTLGETYLHTINRDTTERYSVLFHSNTIQVFDMLGVERTVAFPDGSSYITTTTPKTDMRAVTVADNTFVVNSAVTVASSSVLTPTNASEGLVFIKAVNYDVLYRVRIDGVTVAAFRTDATTAATPSISVAEVIDELEIDLTAALGAGWTFTQNGPVLHILKDDGTPFDLVVQDDQGDTMSLGIKDSASTFADLPIYAPTGYIVEINGENTSAYDNYYLKFVPNDPTDTFGEGVWEETVAPGIEAALDNATMPHQLVRESDGSFTFKQIDWGTRVAGDLTTAEWPSFVGREINDLYFDRNRLCLLADDNSIMSRARSLFDFFPETVVTILDDGPIDISTGGTKVSILKYAVPFQKQTLFFSDQTQFVIEDEDLLASSPPSLKEATAYESDLLAKPVGIGKTLFFTSSTGRQTSVLEYYILPDSAETRDAANVTDHVPTYVPAGVYKMTTSSGTLLALTEAQANRVYVYNSYWSGTEKLQSSWSYWEFTTGAKVLNVEFIKDVAYFVVQYADGVYLETMTVAQGLVDDDAPFQYRLDRRVTEAEANSVTYDAATDRTTIVLPYEPAVATVKVVTRHGVGSSKSPASTAQIASVTGDTILVKGDYTGALFFVGENYVFTYTFSEPVLKTQAANGGLASVIAGRLQLGKWNVTFTNSGYFRAEVSINNRSTHTYKYTGAAIGTSSAVIGVSDVGSGTFSFPVKGKSDRVSISLINDSFLPSYFTGAEWEGRFERKTSGL